MVRNIFLFFFTLDLALGFCFITVPLGISVEKTESTTSNLKRLDWVLLTRQLEFDSYRVATEVLSDHRAIIANIRIKTSEGQK